VKAHRSYKKLEIAMRERQPIGGGKQFRQMETKQKSQKRVDEEMRRANRANSKKQTKREREAIGGGKRFHQMETKPRKNEKGGSVA
jgi:hypothetical protein